MAEDRWASALPASVDVIQPVQNITEARSAEWVELLHLSKHKVQNQRRRRRQLERSLGKQHVPPLAQQHQCLALSLAPLIDA